MSFGGGNQQKLEYLLIASGIKAELAKCALSISLSRETTEEEILKTIGIINDLAKKYEKISMHL